MLGKTIIIFLITAIVILFGNCSSIKYLPSEDNPGDSPYGAFIRLRIKTLNYVEGELIAVDSANIYLLRQFSFIFAEDYQKLDTIPLQTVHSYRLRYINASNTAGLFLGGIGLPLIPFSVPGNSGFMPFHGFFAVITVPVNIITIARMQNDLFTYNDRQLPISKLYKYARFPQGIPENVDIEAIEKTFIE